MPACTIYTEEEKLLARLDDIADRKSREKDIRIERLRNRIRQLKNVIYKLERKISYAESTLPVKVGDTVYAYCEVMNEVMPYFVESLTISYLDEERRTYQFEANSAKDELIDSIDFEPSDIGKYVFLNKSDAEVCCMRNGEKR